MARKRYTPETIIRKLREAEVLQGQGKTIACCRRTREIASPCVIASLRVVGCDAMGAVGLDERFWRYSGWIARFAQEPPAAARVKNARRVLLRIIFAMVLLITFLLVALVFSFLCSIAEAVLLSVTVPYIALLEKKGNPSASLLRSLKEHINKPLSAILTLNTIAHTIGAAGVGAQVTIVFGNAFLGIASVILTLLILIFSEIIPKTLGAHHWRRLAPMTAYGLRFLVWALYPLIWLTEKMTRGLAEGPTLSGFSRQEFAAMAEISAHEGQLAHRESELLRNLLLQRDTLVKNAMTPRPVVFSVSATSTIADFFANHEDVRFSRIPVYRDDRDVLEGFVLRSDLLLAQMKGQTDMCLDQFRRPLPVLPDSLGLARAFDRILRERAHIAQIVDEYGSLAGILTLEDIIETLLGLEIVDEGDKAVDMQEFARLKWQRRARRLNLFFDK